MKKALKDWLVVIVSLLDDLAAVALVLLVLWFFKVRISVWLMIVLALIAGALTFGVGRFVIPTFHKKRVTGREGMVGLKGEVVEPLAPVGLVRVKGECWKARSFNGNIPAGKKVEVTGVDGLVLNVKQKE